MGAISATQGASLERPSAQMHLYLMRHAHPLAVWSSDETRPLSTAGEQQAREIVGGLVRRRRLRVDAIWSSPYTRTQQTAQIAAEVLGVTAEPQRELRADALDLQGLAAVIARHAPRPERLLVVGHGPDLADLLEALVGEEGGDFAHAEVARLEGKRIAAGAMKLCWRLTPGELAAG